MIKHQETILNTVVRRQDTTWKYEWDVDNPEKDGTVFLNPVIYDKSNEKTWYFAPDEDTGANVNTLNDVSEEYSYEEIDGVKRNHFDTQWWGKFNGETRYLRPYNSFLTLTTEVGNVTVDPIPPEFISDEETDYVILSPKYNIEEDDNSKPIYKIASDSTRHFEFQFKDQTGLDFKQFTIKLGADILYEYKRPELDNGGDYIGTFYNTATYLGLSPEDPMYSYYEKDRWIKNIKVKYDGANLYSVEFDLVSSNLALTGKNPLARFFATPYELLNIGYRKTDTIPSDAKFLNKIPDGVSTIEDWINVLEGTLTIEPQRAEGNMYLLVFDLACNRSEYTTGKEFWTIDCDDIDKLEPIQIAFFDLEPSTYFVSKSVNGSVWCNAQDMCKPLWRFPVVAQTLDTSVGIIDASTYGKIEWKDKTIDKGVYNVLTGCRIFKLHNITEHGFIEVEGWVETGNKKIDALLKERTYNTGKCGPWIFEDDGRKYDLLRFVPSYLRNTEFNDFIEWFQLFANTMYTSLDKNRNISALEKIARIGNFNDIDRIENALLMHYENQYANEMPFDKEAIKEVNTLFSKVGWEVKDDEEVDNTIKYVMANLPAYNRYKGSNIGCAAALKMFGFTCKVVNLWIRIKNTIEEEPNFIEEDRLLSKAEFFQTGRFNVEVAANNYFEIFNEHLDFFIDLIKSIKPITKILDSIKYTVAVDKHFSFINNITDEKDNNIITYRLRWDCIGTINNEVARKPMADIVTKTARYSTKAKQCFSLSLPYKPDDSEVINSDKLNNYYTIIGKLLECNKSDIIFKCVRNENDTEIITYYRIPYKGRHVALNPGYFAIGSSNGEGMTSLYNMLFSYINLQPKLNEQIYTESYVEMEIKYIPGTNFIVCSDNFEF